MCTQWTLTLNFLVWFYRKLKWDRVISPVDTGGGGKVVDPWLIRASVNNPPAFSKLVQVPNHRPVGLHVLIPGDAIVVPTQSSNGVPVGAGQDDL